jgi:hypothetical protein
MMPMSRLSTMTTMTSQGELQRKPRPGVLAQSIPSPGHSSPIKIITIIGHSQSQFNFDSAPENRHISLLVHEPNTVVTCRHHLFILLVWRNPYCHSIPPPRPPHLRFHLCHYQRLCRSPTLPNTQPPSPSPMPAQFSLLRRSSRCSYLRLSPSRPQAQTRTQAQAHLVDQARGGADGRVLALSFCLDVGIWMGGMVPWSGTGFGGSAFCEAQEVFSELQLCQAHDAGLLVDQRNQWMIEGV